MIPLSSDFDLGRDETRIKDKRDAQRQMATVSELLRRMFNDDAERRWELQLVADEVGMGKTFVALALAYSILAAMRSGTTEPDLAGCARRILVIAPQNTALAQKWKREVQEFVRRCIPEEQAKDSREWFRPVFVDRLDELAQALRTPTDGEVIVTHMGVLSGSKNLQYYDLKRRYLLGVLFRFWGTRFQRDARARLLKGAPDGWPSQPDHLTLVTDQESDRIPFGSEDEMLDAMRLVAGQADGSVELDELLELCKEVAEPFARERAERFQKVEQKLSRIYRRVCFAGATQRIPLVIVDEAHNWKNGPTQKSNGYGNFERFLGPLTRRALLLTATPFQLRPQEMLELLRVGSVIEPCASKQDAEVRRKRLDRHRDDVIRPVLENAARQSRSLARAWARLPARVSTNLEGAWCSPALMQARQSLAFLANRDGVVEGEAVTKIIDGALAGVDPDLRELLREALRLYTYNEDLSQELGIFVIRHRRRTDHRLVRVGAEFASSDGRAALRPDRHVLHAAPGMDVRGDGELPHYLLMRCVSEMKSGKGRTSLGSELTGCYSTLLASADGKKIRSKLDETGSGGVYLDLLLSLVGEDQDPDHPKVRGVVDSVLAAWRAGEKSLVFCFRTHTARRLQKILSDRIERELAARRKAVLGGAEALTRLRGRFTGRENDLIVVGLDRVLWSLRWAALSEQVPLPQLSAGELILRDDELVALARLALRYGVDLRQEQVDRVFVHRAVEHVLAKRLAAQYPRAGILFGKILGALSEESWVRLPCGVDLSALASDEESTHGDTAGLDERGVHTVFKVSEQEVPEDAAVALGADLRERRERARRQGQVSVFDAYAAAPSFWLGREPEAALENSRTQIGRTLTALHSHLLSMTRAGSAFDWRQRMIVFQALRRALMRESILVRLLPERSDLEEASWGDLLVDRCFTALPGQRESIADRLSVFVEDLQAADGNVYEVDTPRHAMYEATRMRDTGFAVLVEGTTTPERRERVFSGFNSPLLPEVLICTRVGQEGIDLHRHCRNVIHYDLAWNPAVLEQRTGRVDRIGSKTFREREVDPPSGTDRAFLGVGVPFLAGTYDERMYEEIRIRAQTFEVLTGGDVAADNLEGRDEEDGDEGSEVGLAFPTLPATLVADLRVRLHVWEPQPDQK